MTGPSYGVRDRADGMWLATRPGRQRFFWVADQREADELPLALAQDAVRLIQADLEIIQLKGRS